MSEDSKEKPQASVSDAYRKAHKSYVLSSGLLASWFLIGITVETKEKWGLTLQSPKGVPLILIVLVLYFGYRLIIEWVQCDTSGNRAARIDYGVTHLIALTSLLIPAVQFVTHSQIVDVLGRNIERHNIIFRVGITVIGFGMIFISMFLYESEQEKIVSFFRKWLSKIQSK